MVNNNDDDTRDDNAKDREQDGRLDQHEHRLDDDDVRLDQQDSRSDQQDSRFEHQDRSAVKLTDRIESYLRLLDKRFGQILQAAGEAAGNSKTAAREATAAHLSADKVAARIYAPVNKILEKYDSTPPELLDVSDEDILTSVAVNYPQLGERKIRFEQRRAETAEDARVKLEGAKLRAEERAANLAEVKAQDDKRHTRIVAVLVAIAAIGTAAYPAIQLITKLLVH